MVEREHVGAYRLVRRIGVGGMGEVWLATHALLERRAAIKVLHAQFAGRPEVVTRFFNEARAATAIADPGIVQIFDFGQHTNGSAYLVMEMLDGETLDARLRRGPLAIGGALRIGRQVATSLGAAHARGIVHRDLKPENIFLVRDPEVASGERAKILDFGIAKLVGPAGVKTQTATMMGTPTYMSPEQCRGAGQVDARSDIYSFGCVLFQLVTGRPPFDAEGTGEIIAMHLREAAPLASSIAAHVPHELDELIARCLEKNPDERVESAAALASELDALQTIGSAGSIAPVPTVAPHSMPTTLSSMAMEVPPQRGRGRWLFGGVALVAAGAVVTFATVSAGSSDSEERVRSRSVIPVAKSMAVPPSPVPQAERVDNRPAQTTERVADALEASVTWATTHDGCPGIDELGVERDDAWGTPMQIRCTDLQLMVVAAGPDRAFGTADDLATSQPRPAKPLAPITPPAPKKKPTTVPAPTRSIDCFEQRC